MCHYIHVQMNADRLPVQSIHKDDTGIDQQGYGRNIGKETERDTHRQKGTDRQREKHLNTKCETDIQTSTQN